MAETYLIAGLGYGDEGKGTIVDFLTYELGSKEIIRYNGGPQAAHHVVKENLTHCFSQFGSGTFVEGTRTYLSRHMLVDPLALENEEEALRQKGVTDAYERLTIDENCVIVTPMHKLVGQMRELVHRYGSCGLGIGEAVRDSTTWRQKTIRVEDLLDETMLRHKLDFIWRLKLDQAEQVAEQNPNNAEIQRRYEVIKQTNLVNILLDLYCSFITKVNVERKEHEIAGTSIFEGAQGVLLDVGYGFWPHVTKTKTTFANAYALNGNSAKKIGVLRAYATRHGAGPFVSEDRTLTKRIPDMHNKNDEWQGKFRIGWLDLLATCYALDVIGGVDSVALTNLDRIADLEDIKVCVAYEYAGSDNIDDFFDYDIISGKKIIHRIKVQEPTTRDKQQSLKEHLNRCRSLYTQINRRQYLDFVESKLAIPISIISNGPKREDKRIISNIF